MDPSSFNIELLTGGAALDGRDTASGVDRDPAQFQRELGAAREIQDRGGRSGSGAGAGGETDPEQARDDIASTETPRETTESGRDASSAAPLDREPAREAGADREQAPGRPAAPANPSNPETATTPAETTAESRGADSSNASGERSAPFDQVAPGSGQSPGGNDRPSKGAAGGSPGEAPAPIGGSRADVGNPAPGLDDAASGEAGSRPVGTQDGQPAPTTPGSDAPGVNLPRPTTPGTDGDSGNNSSSDGTNGRIGAKPEDRAGQAERNGSGAEVRDNAPATGDRRGERAGTGSGERTPVTPFEPVVEPGSGSRRSELPAQPTDERGASREEDLPRQAPPVKAPAPQPVTSPAPTADLPAPGANGTAAGLGTGTGATGDPAATQPAPAPKAPRQETGADAQATPRDSDGAPRQRVPFERPLDARNDVPASPPPPAHQASGEPSSYATPNEAPIRDTRLPIEPAPQAPTDRPVTPWEQVERASDALRNLPAQPVEPVAAPPIGEAPAAPRPELPIADPVPGTTMPGTTVPDPEAQQQSPEGTPVRAGVEVAPQQAAADTAATPSDKAMPRADRAVPQPSMVAAETAVELNPAGRVPTRQSEAEALVQRTARELGVDGGRDEATHDPRVQVEAASAGEPNKTLVQRHRFTRETEPQTARGVAGDAGSGVKQAADTRSPEPALETELELEPELELADDAEPLNRIKATDSRLLSAATPKGAATTTSSASTPTDSATISETHATQSAGEATRGEAKTAPIPIRPGALAQTLVAQARNMPQNGSMQLRFSLQPEDLGLVKVRIDAKGGQLRIEILASSGQALDAIQSGVARLGSSLQDAGIRDTQIDLGLDHGDPQTESDQLSQRKGDGRGSRNTDRRNEQQVVAPRYVESSGPTTGGDGRLNRVA
ncbi:hypothetical protein ABI59_14545 [Acidobacteria bacterium Mor1]|nr:hypothetical protein ABI59_14545 [Acidobacteria bacterium Mor1]